MGKLIWCLGFIIWAVLVVVIQVSYVNEQIPVPELLEFGTNFIMVMLAATLAITYWRQILKGCWYVLLWVLRLPGLFIMLVATVIGKLMIIYDRALMKMNSFVSPAKKGNYL